MVEMRVCESACGNVGTLRKLEKEERNSKKHLCPLRLSARNKVDQKLDKEGVHAHATQRQVDGGVWKESLGLWRGTSSTSRISGGARARYKHLLLFLICRSSERSAHLGTTIRRGRTAAKQETRDALPNLLHAPRAKKTIRVTTVQVCAFLGVGSVAIAA